MSEDNLLYRVIFIQLERQYEIYAKYINEESLMGFIEVEELVFTDNPGAIVVDPNEDKLRLEFKGVERFYIPMHNVIRIDEVVKQGTAKVIDIKDKTGNISKFPKATGIQKTSQDE
ncbi:MAG: DUF1820 family protein [Gammaproteobacteria bacterium]|nr:DUF1820 family protein [Gammaproteobacteria bacterium]MCH9743904.1 DUF1820 family protein [Gammaproteobacteria bacterium]